MDKKLEKLKQQRTQIDIRIRAYQNRQTATARKIETRKKIIIGVAYMALEKKGVPITGASIMDYIRDCAQDRDKALFFPSPADPGGEQSEQP